uniref:Integrase catalytic domain-containing protein n=1 Tax=Clastoptera arizonana TaxID=38151 RepID=A0A1B6CX63_9HEMI
MRTFSIFPRMEKRIKQFTSRCLLCQCAKPFYHIPKGPLSALLPTSPLELISVDFIGPLPVGRAGVQYIFTVLDVFSKYTRLYAIKKATSLTVINKLLHSYIPEVGSFRAIISDNGPAFRSEKYTRPLEKLHITVLHSSPYNPASQVVERVNQEVGKICRLLCHQNHTKWPLYLPFIEDCLNHSAHCTTEKIPHEIIYKTRKPNFLSKYISFPSNEPLNSETQLQIVRNNLETKAQKRLQKQLKKYNPITYKIDDLVLLKTHPISNKFEKQISKFFLLYNGPYKINNIINRNAYQLIHPTSNNILGTYNTSQLKPFLI